MSALLLLPIVASVVAMEGPVVSSLSAQDIVEYGDQPRPIRKLFDRALELTRQNLGYEYGSDEPSRGGMDCSGTIYYLLRQAGLGDVPRDSVGIYLWLAGKKLIHPVSATDFDSDQFDALKPGDLLFWTGTYAIHRDPPITHVMIYLGHNRLTGRRVMIGASDGRTFNDEPRFGVSVFDFKLPNGRGSSRFIGYGPIAGLLSP
jgi:hypothetical protein